MQMNRVLPLFCLRLKATDKLRSENLLPVCCLLVRQQPLRHACQQGNCYETVFLLAGTSEGTNFAPVCVCVSLRFLPQGGVYHAKLCTQVPRSYRCRRRYCDIWTLSFNVFVAAAPCHLPPVATTWVFMMRCDAAFQGLWLRIHLLALPNIPGRHLMVLLWRTTSVERRVSFHDVIF